VFAQDPLVESPSDGIEPSENLILLRQAAAKPNISAIGSAPYIESSLVHARLNIDHILALALMHDLHVDFHLDYNIDPTAEPLIHYVIDRLCALEWTKRMPRKHVTIGHASRIALFSPEELRALRDTITQHALPITLIGLPQTDMYILGRTAVPAPLHSPALRPRGTLFVTQLVREYGLDTAMSVNNVGNAFTPQGSLDPLSLCTFGVAVFQAGTREDCDVFLVRLTGAYASVYG
jgi:hypothetical protein